MTTTQCPRHAVLDGRPRDDSVQCWMARACALASLFSYASRRLASGRNQRALLSSGPRLQVMHYAANAFAKAGTQTLEAKVEGHQLGQRIGLSFGDVRRLRRMYGCPS